jgi:hypothetical protein
MKQGSSSSKKLPIVDDMYPDYYQQSPFNQEFINVIKLIFY